MLQVKLICQATGVGSDLWAWLAIMSLSETGLPVIAHTAGSDRRFLTYWLSGFGLISGGMIGLYYLLREIGPMHLSVEVLRL